MESTTDVFLNGLKSVKNNMVLFVPAIVLMIITLIGAPAYVVVTAILFKSGYGSGSSALDSSALDSSSLDSSNIDYSMINFLESGFDWISIVPYLCFIIFVFLIYVYITAGLIGMAKETAETGKTGLKHFWLYSKRFFGRILIASIIMSIIKNAALIFGDPTFYNLIKNNIFYSLSYDIPNLISALENSFSPSSVIFVLYIILMSVFFFFVSYAIVVDDFSVIGSYKKSLSLLKAKAPQVLTFIVIFFTIKFIFSAVTTYIPPIIARFFGIILISLSSISISSLFFSPILATFSVVWITRFYMVLTEKPLYVKEK